jgi:hypothetical protein
MCRSKADCTPDGRCQQVQRATAEQHLPAACSKRCHDPAVNDDNDTMGGASIGRAPALAAMAMAALTAFYACHADDIFTIYY